MGYYIEVSGSKNKAKQIVETYGGVLISKPKFEDVPQGKALICVVHNPFFEAAAFIYSVNEYRDFNDPNDFRTKDWVLMDYKKACELTGFE